MPSECISKWVKNCSQRLLNDAELSVLVKGLNYAVTPKDVPVVELVTATETACRKLDPSNANELRSKVVNTISRPRTYESNISPLERKALKDLKSDKSIRILPADKGRCVVILDKSEYEEKCEELLSDSKTYVKLGKRNPTTTYKGQLVKVLSDIEEEGGINRDQYRSLYPTSETPPKFYGLPKIHKQSRPLRPIVSSIGSITYQCSKHISDVLAPLVGKTEHHVANSQQFVDKVKELRVEEDEELRSYDVTALFTSVPVDKALDIIHNKLCSDSTLSDRTTLSPVHITKLLKQCLETTYFVYNDTYYRQIHGAAMGSPVSPIVCNLYMEYLERLAIESAPHPPLWWFRYVDDTHCKLKKEYAQEFTDHLNSLDPDIKFTTEGEEESSLAFLDTLTVRQPDGSIQVRIYRKATHTDQYLNFGSNHPLQHKIGVINTLLYRAKTVITEEEEIAKEVDHITKALQKCHYPQWAIDRAKEKQLSQSVPTPDTAQTNKPDKPKKGTVVIPYIRGLSETLKRVYASYGIQTFFKPTNTLRQILVAPKDKTKKEDIAGPIYLIHCKGDTTSNRQCRDIYIGETERNLKKRFLEHRRPSSVSSSEVAQHIHIESPGHSVDISDVRILDTEHRWFERGVKESIYIRAHNPTLNKDGGRYQLPSVYNNMIKSHVPPVTPSESFC